MKIVRIDRLRVAKRALAEAAAALKAGAAIVMPTETAYGLAADPADRAAVAAVFRIKGRPGGKPLPLIAASLADVRTRFALAGKALALAKRHWPGPLTLVLPYKRGRRLPASPGPTAAVRVPGSAWARALAKAAGGLITSTSANVSGEATLYDAKAVIRSFRGRRALPAIVLDAGRLPVRRPSTIAAVKRGTIEVLRQGSVEVES